MCFRRGVPSFTGPAPKEVVPEKIYGKIFTWHLSMEQIRLMSYSCNDNQSFLVEFTPFDQLITVKRVLESCLEAKPGKSSILKVEVGKQKDAFKTACHTMNECMLHFFYEQPSEAFNSHLEHFNRPPPMGRDLFREWVRIFKSLHHDKIMDCIMEISQQYLGKSLTKVIFFFSSYILMLE